MWRCADCGAQFTRQAGDPPGDETGDTLILNVDDRPTSLYMRRRYLRMNGFAVADAATGEDAWNAALRLRPALILLDIHLPDADGRLLCKRMQADEQLRTIPVVLISATVSSGEIPEPADWGAVGFLKEPVEAGTLAATVRRVLEQR